jgi:hypothetical protein
MKKNKAIFIAKLLVSVSVAAVSVYFIVVTIINIIKFIILSQQMSHPIVVVSYSPDDWKLLVFFIVALALMFLAIIFYKDGSSHGPGDGNSRWQGPWDSL